MRYRLVAKLLSYLIGALAAALTMCLPVAWWFQGRHGEEHSLAAFGFTSGLAWILTLCLAWYGRGEIQKILRKEALAVVGIGWITACLIGSLPFVLLAPDTDWASSFFESTSGLTTTGASVFPDIEALPRSLLFWRALSQWIGGMGVVVFMVAILGFLGAGAKLFYAGEATGSIAEFEDGRIQTTVLHLWAVYLGLSLVCLVCYRLVGLDWFEAVAHMFTTVSTGGFGTRNGSLAAFDNELLEWIAILFMILGGTSFVILWQFSRGHFRGLRRNTELRTYFSLLFLACLFMSGDLWMNNTHSDWHQLIREATFQTVSIMTTTGYTTANYDGWPVFCQMILLVLMFIGGCSASTSGGAKIIRVVVSLKIAWNGLEKSYRKNIVRPVKVNGRVQDEESLKDVLAFLAVLVLLSLAGFLMVGFLETELGFVDAVSAVQATLFCIGPGFGMVGPEGHFGSLTAPTKVFLSFLMLMGRLELFAILVLFTPGLWRTFR